MTILPFVFAAATSVPAAASEGYLTGAEGVRLFHRRFGGGRDTVVFLHGGPGANFRGQDDFVARLAATRTVVVYDQRGSGLSELVAEPARLTAADHVRDLESVRRQLGVERLTLVGMSWGSGLAALYAAEHPDRVNRIVFMSPMPPTRALFDARFAALDVLKGPEAVARRREMSARVASAPDAEIPALCRELVADAFRFYFAEPSQAKTAHAQRRCDIPAAAFRNRVVVERATLGSLGAWDLRSTLARIRVPALVMEGAGSQVPLDATREWAASLPRGRLALVPGAGHEFFVDRPEESAREIERFLRR